MNAIIVKNNDFETIGFEVTASGKTLFYWGISSTLKSNFQKEVNVNDWMTEIFELVRLTAIIGEQRHFTREFFEAAHKNNLLKSGQSVDLNDMKERIDSIELKIQNIIKNII